RAAATAGRVARATRTCGVSRHRDASHGHATGVVDAAATAAATTKTARAPGAACARRIVCHAAAVYDDATRVIDSATCPARTACERVTTRNPARAGRVAD